MHREKVAIMTGREVLSNSLFCDSIMSVEGGNFGPSGVSELLLWETGQLPGH